MGNEKKKQKILKGLKKERKEKEWKWELKKILIMRCVRLWCHYGAHKFSRLVNCFKKNDSLCFGGEVLVKSLKNGINYFLLSSFEFWGRMSRDWRVIMHSSQVFLIFWEKIYAILGSRWKKNSHLKNFHFFKKCFISLVNNYSRTRGFEPQCTHF